MDDMESNKNGERKEKKEEEIYLKNRPRIKMSEMKRQMKYLRKLQNVNKTKNLN
jgi:hypothetical protein